MNPDERYAVNPGWRVVLTDLGVAPADVLRRAGLPADLLAREGATLAQDEYFRLWRAVEEDAGDPDLPVRIARALTAEVFDPPLFAALCSPDLNTAARRIARYKKLIGPMRLLVSESATGTTLQYVWPDGAVPPRVLGLCELLFWVALARLGVRAEVRPVQVTIPDPPDSPAYREYLGVPILHRATQSVTFSAGDAGRPFLTAKASMWGFFEPGLRQRLAELDTRATVADRVRGALLELLPAGTASVDAVARELATSVRTLQRRLRDEDTTFQDVLGSTRRDLATHYLSTSAMPAAEISFLLGYEDTSSFYRAFRGWTGETPDRVRAAAR